jgi:sugar diacid utilization regulator
MTSVDQVLEQISVAAMQRVSRRGGDRQLAAVRLAEQFAELKQAPPLSLVILSRAASEAAVDYRLDLALRWAAARGVSAVGVLSEEGWIPSATAADIADWADIALVSIPDVVELTRLMQAIVREIGGGAEQALARADQGLTAVLRADSSGFDLEGLRAAIARALGLEVRLELVESHEHDAAGQPVASPRAGRDLTRGSRSASEDREPPVDTVADISVAGQLYGRFVATAHGDLALAARLVLNAAALAAGRRLDLVRYARELPIRSRSELLAELLMSDAPLSADVRDRARQLGVPVAAWHVAVRIEAENLDAIGRDEVQRFELLETAGQAALQACIDASGGWHLSRIGRAIFLVHMTASPPGAQAGLRAARSAERGLAAINARIPGLVLRAGVGTAHEGAMGLRASAAEARIALVAARSSGKKDAVTVHDATGVQRMLMEWYATETARTSVQTQLAPLEQLGPKRGTAAIRTLAVYLDQQGSIVRTAKELHLHRNAVTYRLRRITELLGADLEDPDQRLAIQLACRARLLY